MLNRQYMPFFWFFFFLSKRWNPAFYFANCITWFHLNREKLFSKILNCFIWAKWNNNVLPQDRASKIRKGTYAPPTPRFKKKKKAKLVFHNNSAKRTSGSLVRMSVNEEFVIVFCAYCFNDTDSFRHARTHYTCWAILNVTATTESLACASDQGTYCEQSWQQLGFW